MHNHFYEIPNNICRRLFAPRTNTNYFCKKILGKPRKNSNTINEVVACTYFTYFSTLVITKPAVSGSGKWLFIKCF